MSENIRVVVTGVSGRMGQMIVSGVLSSTKTRLVGALEREGHDWIGKDLGLVSGLNTFNFNIHLTSRNSICCSSDFEIHIAKVIFIAQDIG